MWLTKENARRREVPSPAETAVVTLAEGTVAAYGRGEQRGLGILSPGGVLWRPEVGDAVLTLQADGAGAPYVAGEVSEPAEELAPGELLLRSKGASIHLRNDGVIEVRGTVIYKEETE